MSNKWPFFTEPTHTRSTSSAVSGYGARDTRTSSTEERLIVDATDRIFLLEPNKHPLVTLLTNVGKVWDGKAWKGAGIMKRPTGNPEFKWLKFSYT